MLHIMRVCDKWPLTVQAKAQNLDAALFAANLHSLSQRKHCQFSDDQNKVIVERSDDDGSIVQVAYITFFEFRKMSIADIVACIRAFEFARCWPVKGDVV